MNRALNNKLTPEQKKRLNELISRLPPTVQAMAKKDPAALSTALQVEKKNRDKNYPSIDFVPNIAQERALKCLSSKHPVYGDYPKKIMFIAANGIGKTCNIGAILLPGMCLGPEFVNRQYCNWQYFYDCAEIRKKRPLLVRLVCDAKDMKENAGSLYQQIKKWIPTAKFKDKTGEFYQTVIVGDVIIDVKTHNMPDNAHAGPDYDAVIFNEPPPKSVYSENVSRTRMGGRVFLFLTPMGQATYLAQDVNNPEAAGPEGSVCVTEGNIWENCRDIPGTRGQLSKRDIDFLVSEWKKEGHDTYMARAFGKFSAFAGLIYGAFTDHVHVIDPFKIPSDWNLYHLMDPHEVKPPFAMWIVKDPMNNSYIVAEYPEGQWDQIRSTQLTIKHFCREWDMIENGRNTRFPYMPQKKAEFRIGDPNRMNVRYPNSGRTLRQEYAFFGYDFDVTANDDITLGHSAVKELLYYDKERELSATNTPRLFVFRNCVNTRQAFKEYMTDQATGKIIETWKCPMDLVRYYCDKAEPWQNISSSDYEGDSDYMDILRGRDPGSWGSEEEQELVYPSCGSR